MIIDASVAFKWLVHEDDSDLALALLRRDDLLAPNLVSSEVGNALWKKARREQFDPTISHADVLATLPSYLALVEEHAFIGRALEIAYALDHAIYDCVYLAAAEHFGLPLVTADDRFLRKLELTEFRSMARTLREAVA